MAKKKGFIGGLVSLIAGVIFAALAIRNLIRAMRHAYRAVRGIGR